MIKCRVLSVHPRDLELISGLLSCTLFKPSSQIVGIFREYVLKVKVALRSVFVQPKMHPKCRLVAELRPNPLRELPRPLAGLKGAYFYEGSGRI